MALCRDRVKARVRVRVRVRFRVRFRVMFRVMFRVRGIGQDDQDDQDVGKRYA